MPEARTYLREDGTSPFEEAFSRLKDAVAKAQVDSAVRKLGRGLEPDVKSVAGGVHEARIDYGPGYRVYFASDGTELVVLLLCGDKTTQHEDIADAKALWASYRTRKKEAVPRQGRSTPLTRV